MSIPGLAKQLQCSPSSLRDLLSALHAPAADLAAARQGKISTNELVRRGRAEAERRKKKKLEARELKRKRKAIEASKMIGEWLEKEQLSGSRGEAIALEARSMLIKNYDAGTLPHADPQVLHPAAEWIKRCRPNTPVPDDTSYIAWYAFWLAQWSFCLCRDAELAIDALTIAGKL
jgi:hypothetical protein